MYCVKCGKKLGADGKCSNCDSKSKQTKILISIVAVLTVIAIGLSMVILTSKSGNVKTYEEVMDLGKNSYKDQKYEEAEKYFLQAVEKEANPSQAYAYLYTVYQLEGEEKKANDIKDKALQSLDEQAQKDFEQTIQTLESSDSNVVYALTGYNVVKQNLPDFQLPLFDDGNAYLAKVNGYYGFMDIEGEWILDRYDYVGIYGSDVTIALGETDPDVYDGVDSQGNILENMKINVAYSAFGTGGPNPFPFLNENGEVKVTNVYTMYSEEMKLISSDLSNYTGSAYLIRNLKESDIQEYHDNPRNGGLDFGNQYYIWTPKTNTVHGPYEQKELPFGYTGEYSEINFSLPDFYGGFEKAKEVFYEKKDGKYVVYNEDGTKSKTYNVDSMECISAKSIKFTKDGKMGVIDGNLEVVLYGDFEDVSTPIQNRCYVKKDGKWILIDTSGKKEEKKQDEKKHS